MANCPQCNQPGKQILTITIAHNVDPSALPAGEHTGSWFVCLSNHQCNVVYFCGPNAVLRDQVRQLPYHKGTDASRLACFCFGHTEQAIAAEKRDTGRSSIQAAIRDACRSGRGNCEHLNPKGACCLGDVARILESVGAPMTEPRCRCPDGHAPSSQIRENMTGETTTLETLKAWARANTHFPVFTSYDATTARWLARGGAKVLLVGDSAGRFILGLGDGEHPSVEFMTEIGAAVGRGAPGAFVIVDYPNDLADSSLDHGRRIRKLLHDSAASAVKVEGDAQ